MLTVFRKNKRKVYFFVKPLDRLAVANYNIMWLGNANRYFLTCG